MTPKVIAAAERFGGSRPTFINANTRQGINTETRHLLSPQKLRLSKPLESCAPRQFGYCYLFDVPRDASIYRSGLRLPLTHDSAFSQLKKFMKKRM